MKKLLCICSFLIGSINTGFCQEESHGWITISHIVVYGYDLANATSVPATKKVANPNIKFRQIGGMRDDANLGEIYVIQFSIDNEPSEIQNDNNKVNIASTSKGEFYCVKSVEYNETTIKKRYKTWAYNQRANIGTLVIPIKFRSQRQGVPFDYTTDFTIGPSFGYSFRTSHYQPNYLNIVGVAALTSVGVDSITTKGYIKEANTKLSAVTIGFGAVAEVSNFQIGAVIGWDYIGGRPGQHWIYNGKSWFSFAIGYQFIRKTESNK